MLVTMRICLIIGDDISKDSIVVAAVLSLSDDAETLSPSIAGDDAPSNASIGASSAASADANAREAIVENKQRRRFSARFRARPLSVR